MATKLQRTEIYVYFIVWISSFSYAFYRVYLDGGKLASNESRSLDFDEGWIFLNRKRDKSDYEWELWTEFLFELIPWVIFHLCLSEITRLTFIEFLPLCYLFTTIGVLATKFPLIVLACYILQLTFFYVVMMTCSKFLIWSLAVISLIFITYGLKPFLLAFTVEHNQASLIYVSFGWFYIRCLDFIFSEVGKSTSLSKQFLNYVAYIFYLPCFFFGPFIPYDHFKFQMHSPTGNFMKERASKLFSSLFLLVLYYILYELAAHFLYCNAMHYEIRDFIPFGMWTISGVGICMANFFYLKYIIIYGISISIAKAENYKIPPHPKCIYRIHLYSKMWRHFDRGFYLFMFRCIYSPVCRSRGAPIKRKMFASFLCFLFVYVWHGGTITVFYWSLFNFIGLISEAVCRHLWADSSSIKCYFVKHFSPSNIRRLEALAASPLWLFAVISNFIFFGGHDLGLLFFEKIIQGSLVFYITVIIIAYSMCQVSIETDIYEQDKLIMKGK